MDVYWFITDRAAVATVLEINKFLEIEFLNMFLKCYMAKLKIYLVFFYYQAGLDHVYNAESSWYDLFLDLTGIVNYKNCHQASNWKRSFLTCGEDGKTV